MARMAQAQKIQRENEEQALSFFREALAVLPDARRGQGLRYPLQTVVVTALMAMVCGCDDAEAMQSWGEANAQWLDSMLEMPHGPPTQDVFLAVFAALDPETFSAVFRAWTELLSLRLQAGGKHIAIDGKTSRRSFDTASGKRAVHTVSAWMSEAGLAHVGPALERSELRGAGRQAAHCAVDGQDLHRNGLLHRQRCGGYCFLHRSEDPPTLVDRKFPALGPRHGLPGG